MKDIEYTGERFVPEKSSSKMNDEHVARYHFAGSYVKNKRVLDIACGVGYGSILLAGYGATHVDGVDISEEAVHYAQSVNRSDNVTFRQSDITTYCSDEKYDVIVSFETIEHIPCYLDALRNLKTLLKAGGFLLISSPNRLITSPKCKTLHDRPKNQYHTQEFTVDELFALLRDSGFSVDETVYGQKHQPYFKSRLMKNIYREIFKPGQRLPSTVVKTPNNKEPRYFILIAS